MYKKPIILLTITLTIFFSAIFLTKYFLSGIIQQPTIGGVITNQGNVIFSDDFESYTDGQQSIRVNMDSSANYPKYYSVGASGNCGNPTWQASHPAPPGESYAMHEPCIVLNGQSTQWFQGGAFYVSSMQAHSGTKSLYMQDPDAPDKVAPAFTAGPGVPATIGNYVTFGFWVYLGPAFATTGVGKIYFTAHASGCCRINYNDPAQGHWSYAYQNDPVQYTDLGSYPMSSGAWHHVVVVSQITGSDSAQYISLQIDGATPFDTTTLKGKTIAGRVGLPGDGGFWMGNPYSSTDGYWNGHADGWLYIDDLTLSLSSSPPTSTTTTPGGSTTTTLPSGGTTTTTSSTTTSIISSTSTTTNTQTTSTTTTTTQAGQTTTTTIPTISTTTTQTQPEEKPLIEYKTILIIFSVIGLSLFLIYFLYSRFKESEYDLLKKKWSKT